MPATDGVLDERQVDVRPPVIVMGAVSASVGAPFRIWIGAIFATGLVLAVEPLRRYVRWLD